MYFFVGTAKNTMKKTIKLKKACTHAVSDEYKAQSTARLKDLTWELFQKIMYVL